jgi:Ca2+-transporting ATPase
MEKPPRNLNMPMFNRTTISISLIQGASVLLVVFLLFYLSIKFGQSEFEARSLAFSFLVLSNILLIVTNLAWNKGILQFIKTGNKALFIISSVALISLCLVLYIPFFSEIFHLVPLQLNEVFILIIAMFMCFLWLEMVKHLSKIKF